MKHGLLALLILLVAVIPALAQEPEPAALLDEGTITLRQMGFAPEMLRSPRDRATFTFGVPAEWSMGEGAELKLNLEGFTSGTDQMGNMMGFLNVTLNDVPLDYVIVDLSQDNLLTIPLPAEALVTARTDGRHELELELETEEDCETASESGLILQPDSAIVLPHTVGSPVTDLRQLPRPLFQQTFVPDAAVIVVPDAPTAGEMQAALTVAAGLGKMTYGQMTVSLQAAGTLAEEARAGEHLIYVATTDHLPADLMPAVTDLGEDGLVQMFVSPWNEAKIALVVTGAGEAGVIKAGQAFSTGQLRTEADPSIARIADVQPNLVERTSLVVNQNFADAGYAPATFERVGTSRAEYTFTVPAGQTVDVDTYLDVVISHSTLMDYTRSGLVVYLNDTPIGSVRLSDQTASNSTVRMGIPPSLINNGNNVLLFEAEMRPMATCYEPSTPGTWMTISDESSLNIALDASPSVVASQPLDLGEYPYPFAQDPSLSSTAFVLPTNDPFAWNTAAQLAYSMGDAADGTLLAPRALFADQLSPEVRDNYNLVVVGRPTDLPVLADLGDNLPAPVAADGTTTERTMPVVYRTSNDKPLGYLQMLLSPNNSNRYVLTVLGNNEQGVEWAGNALTQSDLRFRLFGDYATIDDVQVIASNRLPAERDINLGPSAEVQAATASVNYERPAWVLPVALLAAIAMAVILLGVVGTTLVRR